MKYELSMDQLCPATFAFQVIGGKWNLPILACLSEEEGIRYNELKRRLNGITGTTLTNCLKELIDNGIVHRQQYNEIPPRVEYSLTPSGMELVPLIQSIVAWGEKNMHTLKSES
ncbi:transcriptional regulator [Paenibacillus sp. FSL R7-0273]|uniref:winged helix-turn-helix transcriptional regulator n=1 Tax=Paenibacillus sp. FSL R7-0273 TaxID=1536772 RepID=UPI0004F5CA7A|nr:helix-turn-helix domain-containing protein [Paenibacillus sp. FSL R7-0273]AIQ47349.1 transcriptional regulator [Paenibacillus sp. FSL R7-0273]OMF96098.1 transcriptional regulator [Paenibacillus sp. FSL R7-0273]